MDQNYGSPASCVKSPIKVWGNLTFAFSKTHNETMEVSEDRKEELRKQILERLLSEWESGKINQDESANIANYVLDSMPFVFTEQDLLDFLNELISKWAFFGNLLTIEKGKRKEKVSGEMAEGAATLARHGKLDDALKLAKKGSAN